MIVPLGAGSSADQVARLVAARLADQLRQAIVVENRSGAGTIVGAAAVARAAADGHTLLFAPSGTLTINSVLYKKLPYDAAADFVPIAHVSDVPLILVTGPSSPQRSLHEMIAAGRQAPARLVVASSGVGTANHLAAELFQEATGIALVHVPYRDSAAGLRDVAAGHVQLMFADVGAALPLIRSGKVRALGLSIRQPLALAPDVAPLADLGLGGFDAGSWHMLLAPAATPPAIAQRLNREMATILAEPALRSRIESLGLTAAAGADRQQLIAFVESERRRWHAIVERLGLARSQ